jgi:hypothetical protein
MILFRRKHETRAQRLRRAGKSRYLSFIMWHGALVAAVGRG